MPTIRPFTQTDTPGLLAIWERSVTKTHHFLTPGDIAAIKTEVGQALVLLEVWVVEANGEPAGFMGLDGDKVEALFIDPDCMGMGLGTLLLRHVRELRGADATLLVDVNLDNPDAVGFYAARGFVQIGRSEADSAGRPFPLLHLEQKPGSAK